MLRLLNGNNLASCLDLAVDKCDFITTGYNKFSIAKSTKDVDGSFKLLQYLTSADQMTDVTRLYGGLPTRKDLEKADWSEGIYAELMATANDAVSQPAHPAMMQLGPAVKNLLEPAIGIC